MRQISQASAGKLVGKILRHLVHEHTTDPGFYVVPTGSNICIESSADLQ